MRFSSTLLTSCLIATVFFSCRKTGNNVPLDTVVSKNVKQVTWSSSDFASYEYNETGNVMKHISQWDNGGGGINRLTSNYSYDNNGNLTQWSNEAGYGNYIYTNGVLNKSEHFAANGKKISTLTYSFYSDGRLRAVTEQNAKPYADDVKETKTSYQYHPDGNVSRIDFAYRQELTDPFTINFSKVFVTYDTKKNPEPDGVSGVFLPGVILHISNPVRINTLSPNGDLDNYLRFEYSYNDANLPVQRKQFIETNGVEQAPVTSTYSY